MVYVNGKITENNEARISVYDHGLLYGDGVFEGLRIYNGGIFKLDAHMDRLYESAKAILLDIGMEKEELKREVLSVMKASDKTDGYIRLIVTRGEGFLGIDPSKCAKPTVIIIVDNISLYPEEMYRNGIEVITASVRRLPPDGVDPRIKSLNYLNNILGKIEAKHAGCAEAVMLNSQGRVAECTVDNIFIVKRGVLKTPPLYDGPLGGITRETILELSVEAGIPTAEESMTCFDLYTADEMFLTGSGAEIIPVVKVDGRSVGPGTPGKISQTLRTLFKESV